MRFKDSSFPVTWGAESMKFILQICVLAWLCNACAWLGIQPGLRFDERSFSVMNVNLFDQRVPSSLSKKNWKGDWLFRRERLELVDEQLRVTRPDIVVFQEMLTRRDSPSESDINILSAGALEGYQWDADPIQSFEDTQEMQYNSVAVGLPIKLQETEALTKNYWPVGSEGYMTYSLLELDRKPILLVNLSMPKTAQKADYWYRFVRVEVRELLTRLRVCEQRLVVSGHMPGGSVWPGYSDFLKEFNLKDTASGFCEAASDCLTTSTQNDLFMATSQGQAPAHSERILVHEDALILSSNTVLQKMREKTVYGPTYGIHRLWASPDFGWQAQLRLPQCKR